MNIDSAIKGRKTQKVFAKKPWESSLGKDSIHQLVEELLDLAAHAPYHHKANDLYTIEGSELTSCLPFRFYILDSTDCQILNEYIKENKIVAGKIVDMLNATDLLFMVTWLPEPRDLGDDPCFENGELPPFDGSLKNMEHIAAASSAIQNVLIGATSRGIPNYWSSGGKLRQKKLRNFLGITMNEILLGAIFLFPKDVEERGAMIFPGRLREEGKEKNTWVKWLELRNLT